MKNHLIFCLAALGFLAACHRDCHENMAASDCLKDKFEQFKQQPDAVAILATTNYLDTMYLLRTNASYLDGTEYFLGKNCDTVCILCGECLPPGCLTDFSYDKTVVVWEK